MTAQALRDEMHKMIDNLDESRLEVIVNRWKEDLEILGYEGDGEPVTLGDLKEDIKQADQDIDNGYFLSAKDARKESQNW